MPPSPEIHQQLGAIQAKLDLIHEAQTAHSGKIDGLTERLGKVESKAQTSAATISVACSAFIAVGAALIKQKLGLGS